MSLSEKRSQKISLLQNNLPAIRQILGWTAEEMGEKMGVSKQTISNLETKRSSMSWPQFITIRLLIYAEAQANPDNKLLGDIVSLLLDDENSISEEDSQKLTEAISAVSAAAKGGANSNLLKNIFFAVAGGIGLGLAAGALISGKLSSASSDSESISESISESNSESDSELHSECNLEINTLLDSFFEVE